MVGPEWRPPAGQIWTRGPYAVLQVYEDDMLQCPAINPASGRQCTRPANGHDDHETVIGDLTQKWRPSGRSAAIIPPMPTVRQMPALQEVVERCAYVEESIGKRCTLHVHEGDGHSF